MEVAIGLVFCYASVALIVSSINEAIASILKLRSKSLLDGVKSLLNDPNFNGLALNIYNHGLVSPHDQGNAANAQDLTNKPSYIDPKHFAIALIDSIQTKTGDFIQLGADINAISDPQIKQLLQSIYTRASGKIENVHAELATWFDAGMNRLSGNYKRRSQLHCFIIALAIAILFNIDSFHLFTTLWQHPAITTGITPPTDSTNIPWEMLMSLPVGWSNGTTFTSVVGAILSIKFAGWLVTASASLFGAPFWFDLLQNMVRLRGTGNKPGSDSKPAAN
ncbi:MAG TPA: hypothetical protein VIE65_05775 [Methylobacter sp.]